MAIIIPKAAVASIRDEKSYLKYGGAVSGHNTPWVKISLFYEKLKSYTYPLHRQ